MEQIAESSPVVRRQTPRHGHRGKAAKVHGRSAITNGKTLLPTASGCSIWARLVRGTMANLVSHCGGDALISETQKLFARRVSVLESELVFLEDKIALTRQHGDEPDQALVEHYGRLADRQRRLADPLGWHRAQREVSWRDKWLSNDSAPEVETPTSDAAAVVVVPPESDNQ